jgi:hypothetical protein
MTTSFEKQKVELKIATSFYKHRGNVDDVSSELGINPSYIKKVTDKLRRRMRRDVATQVAVQIMQTIHVGYQQRTTHLTECLNKLRDVEDVEVSFCCNAPTYQKEEGGQSVLRCLKCSKVAHLHTMNKPQVYRLVQDFVRELREEDKLLLEFADKMGFTLREQVPTNIYRSNVLVLGDKKPARDVMSDEDRTLLKEFDKMTPMERQRTRRVLEKKLLEGDVEDEG